MLLVVSLLSIKSSGFNLKWIVFLNALSCYWDIYYICTDNFVWLNNER